MEWISVDDRLPERDEDVLIFCNNTGFPKGIYVGHRRWYDDLGDELFQDGEYKNMPNTTHWMPLPKPPKP